MISNADITLFHKAMGPDRREILIPTVITGVCWYDIHSVEVSKQQGMAPRDRAAKFVIRIPITAKIQDNREYLPEEAYRLLSEERRMQYWTIQLNGYVAKGIWPDIREVQQMHRDFGTVVEYADNTLRGSPAVRHFRIGGA